MKNGGLKFGIIYFSSFFAVLFALRICLCLIEPFCGKPSVWSSARARDSLNAISKFGSSGHAQFLFLGTSEIEIGFSPVIFDESLMHGPVTLNLAVRNVGSFLPLYLTRIAKEIEKSQTRPRVIYIHVPISRMTHKALSSSSENSKVLNLPAIYFDLDIWNQFRGKYSDIGFYALNKYIFGERSLSQISYVLRTPLRLWINTGDFNARQNNFWGNDILHTDPPWDETTRGYLNWNNDHLNSEFQRIASLISRDQARRLTTGFQRACCDFLDLNIDWNFAQEIQESILKLKKLADHVVLVQPPEHPDLERSPEALARFKDGLHFLKNGSGAELWDLTENSNFTPDDFIDVIHFSSHGTSKFTKIIAHKTQELLRN